MGQRFIKWFSLLTVFFMFAAYCSSAEAVLKAFGPLNFAGFPAYYQDVNNLALQQCLSQAVSPVTGLPICGMLAFPTTTPPFDPTLPVTFPPNPAVNYNFPLEAFYMSAQPPPAFKNLAPGAGKVIILNNLEGSFGLGNPVPGSQVVFSRVRIWLLGASTGRYKITHPFGVDFMDVVQTDILTQKMTRDIGAVGIAFAAALPGDIGPFLRWTPDPALIAAGTQRADGTIPAVNPLTGAAELYVGDPNIPHTFTGSPFGTNFWRIDGPPGSGIGGPGIDFIQSSDVILIGQKFTAAIPTPLTVDRATYSRSGLTGQMNFFASSGPLSNQATPSVLTVSGVNIPTTTMTGNATGSFFSSINTPTPSLIPPTVNVTNTADVPPTLVTANLVDDVVINTAHYDVVSTTLTVQASSADKFLNPALTVVGLGPIDPLTGMLSLKVPVPPANVTVQSAARGAATAPVITASNLPPIANNDSATTASGTAVTVNVVANDTDPDGTINTATITIVTPPLNGTAVANPTGTVTYTPAAGFVGTNTFTYTVKDNLGAVSNIATVTVSVVTANLPPVAANDVATTLLGTPVIINVIANDIDPDGFINPTTVSVVTAPANGTAIANPNGTVTFTPNPAFVGTNTFNYVVADNLGALSNVALVTVTVNAANVLPVAVNDTASTSSGLGVAINVLANDTPTASLNPASVIIVTAPANGTAVASAAGTVTYTSAAGFTGTNTFTYTVKDNLGTISNPATVTVTVVSNVPPVANNDSAVTPIGVAATLSVLANDVASVGNTINVASIVATQPALGGTVLANANGTITFTPAALFTGTSTFTYTVLDSRGVASNAATVSVTVTASPVATADAAATFPSTPVIINVLANDTAATGNSLNPASIVIVTPPLITDGTVVVNANGTVTFTPTASFVGPSTFTYTVKDNHLAVSNAATVTVTLSASTTPVAADDTAVTPAGATILINVLANDVAAAGKLLVPASVAIVTAPPVLQGTAVVSTLAPNIGAITFTPAAGFTGASSFTYTVQDNTAVTPATSNVATVTVTVAAAPTAVNDIAATPIGTAVIINVLANDSAVVGNTLNPATVIVTQPLSGGSVLANANGTVTFTPAAGFTGISTFTYTVKDNLGTVSLAATVTVTVTGTTAPPVANADAATTIALIPVTVNVLANDSAALGNTINPATVTVVQPPVLQGTATVNALTGAVTFTPAAGFTGISTFTYTVKDNLALVSNSANITITVNAAALPPVAANDTATAQSGIATPINILANDTAPSSTINPATVTIVTQPLNGTAVANATGIVTYTSVAGFVGTTSFTYTVKDNLGATSNAATVTVTVNAANIAPTANPDTATTTAGTAATINVIANDTDPDGTINPASVFVITQPLNGTAVAQLNGTVIYTPAAGFTGSNSFTYTVKDNLGAVSNTATVTVTVNAVAVAVSPTAVNDLASTNKNTPVTISVLANDTAAVGNTLAPASVFILTQPLNGSAAATAAGTVVFTPALNFVGTTSFTYNVRDNLGTASNTATVTVTVLNVNVPPVALNTSASMLSGVNPNVVFSMIPTFISDVDGTVNPATVTIVTPPLNGTAVVNLVTGAITYTPNPGFVGVNTFTYTAQDNLGAVSNIGTITVTINAPVAETIAITRALFTLNGTSWRLDGTTTARVLGETVQVFNSPTAPAAPSIVGLVMTAPVDVAGGWTQVAKPGPALNALRLVSIRTSLGTVVNNIPMVVR